MSVNFIKILFFSIRSLYLKRIGNAKQARAQVKLLRPSSEYLFGGKVSTLVKDLKNSAELNPLARTQFQGYKNSYYQKNNYTSRGFIRGYKNNGKGAKGRGAGNTSSGSRINKFKS